MLAKEIREKTNEELLQEIDTLKDELFKKTIARIKTVLTERENAGQE